MKELIIYLDGALIALIALTISLIVFKSLQLYTPLGKGMTSSPPIAQPELVNAQIERLYSGLVVLGAIASSAPFLGLGGTVVHIMLALEQLSSAAVDVTFISGPIAHALKSTLLGLCSAIPALVAHQLLHHRAALIANRLKNLAFGS